MKKTLLFIVLAVIITACPNPDPPECPECPEPSDTLYLDYSNSDVFAEVLIVPENVGVIVLTDTTPCPVCPECPECPECPPCPPCPPVDCDTTIINNYYNVITVIDECTGDTTSVDTTAAYEGEAYFVATNGNDNNPGTFDEPWLTWSRAFNASELEPGDTVYFRGGIYPHTASDGWDGVTCTVDGNEEAYIHFFNYPGEEPILDSKGIKVEWNHNRGLYMKYVHYVHFKGLTIQNVEQRDRGTVRGDIEATAWHFRGTDCIIEQCVVRNCHGGGIGLNQCDNVLVLNCDGFNMVDSFTSVPASNPMPGNDGTAFSDWNTDNQNAENHFIGNRAWGCGDQGFSDASCGYTYFENNWSFRNGVLEGGGHGYKMGRVNSPDGRLNRLYRNNLAAFNRGNGWDTNDGNDPCGVLQVENNIAYGNGVGYRILNSSSSIEYEQESRVYENNVAYANGQNFLLVPHTGYTGVHNSWNISEQVNESWFVSLDASQLDLPRKADGSLPDIDFLKLTPQAEQIMGW